MHEAPDDGGRELGPSHAAKVAQRRDIDRAELCKGCVNSSGERAQNCCDVRREHFLTFRPNRDELFRRQRVPASVGEETVDDPGHMAHMKGR